MTELQKRKLVLFVGLVVVIGAIFWAYKAYESKKIGAVAWPELNGGLYASEVTRDGVTSLVPGDEIYDSGVLEGGIPALTNPKYASVLASDSVIADSLYGIDLAINGEHRFYPVQILNWHEVVNDSWGGKDIAVTYCPLCGTGIVYDRQFDGGTMTFSATGQVYNNNSILKDGETGSLWVQGLGTAVQGSMIGKSLTVIPSSMMTWADWKSAYPSGSVLSTDTGVTRDYTRHPYGAYDTSKGLYFPINYTSASFTSKWVVYGVTDGANGLAFSDVVLSGTGLNTAKLGEESVIAVYDFATNTARIFNAGVHTFSYDFAKKRLTDNETGSVWNASGVATSGSLKGEGLDQYQVTRGFWACLSALHPTWTAVTTAAETASETIAE
ncbi:MAG: DUF3179 domain-containing protein [Patescibacteria group bacterium]|jgi:hypothetical protein